MMFNFHWLIWPPHTFQLSLGFEMSLGLKCLKCFHILWIFWTLVLYMYSIYKSWESFPKLNTENYNFYSLLFAYPGVVQNYEHSMHLVGGHKVYLYTLFACLSYWAICEYPSYLPIPWSGYIIYMCITPNQLSKWLSWVFFYVNSIPPPLFSSRLAKHSTHICYSILHWVLMGLHWDRNI